MASHQIPSATTADRPIDVLLMPFQRFARIEAAGGILLLVCAAIALIWANSPWHQSYYDLWHTYISIDLGFTSISESLAHWVNDGLMAIFFFVVGLEIKRELVAGELSSARDAAVPVAAAIGGMLVPSLIYAVINKGGDGMAGWAIPAATDIAFALGIMALLGKRVPLSLKIFLTAVAIVDDIGAVLIIAVFYTSEISWIALGLAGAVVLLLIVLNVLHVRSPLAYLLPGLVLWGAFLESGVHATIAGVLLAFTIPSKFRIDGARFTSFARRAVGEFAAAGGDKDHILTNPRRQSLVHGLEQACEQVQTPLSRLEHRLHPWVSFVIMPVFALANAGVVLGPGLGEALGSRVCLGVVLGLVLGKPVGILLSAWIVVRLGVGSLPEGTTWRQLVGVSCLAGIGFTMSLFIAALACGEGALLEQAKIGILSGSLVSGIVGYLLLRAATRDNATAT